MATLYAQGTGNLPAITWNTAANGSGSNQVPTSADTLVANGYIVTLDADYTFVRLMQTSNGGKFVPASGTTTTLTDATTGLVSGSTSTPACFEHSGAFTANLVGKIVGTSYTSPLIGVTGSGTLNVTTTSLSAQAAYSTGLLSISGVGSTTNVIAGQILGGNSSAAIVCSVAATLDVTGPQTGGTLPAISITGSATVTITGTSTASAAANAVSCTHASAVLKCSGPFVNNGRRMAVYSQVLQIGSSSTYWNMVDYSNVARNLYTADTIGGNPAASNVRYGTVFGPASELVGTCYVPAAASVLYGVPVDATTGTVTLAAADIRSALGMSSANLDTQLSNINTKTTNIPASPAAVGSAMTLTSDYDAAKTAASQTSVNSLPSNSSITAAILASAIETGYTLKQSVRLMLAALAGKLSGADGTTVTIRDAADAKNRIVATVDANGNRTAVTHDTSD